MPESYPSKILIVLDVPEVNWLDAGATFSYNFFTPDEKVNDDGTHMDPYNHMKIGPNGATEKNLVESQHSKRHPRFVVFSFSPVDIRTISEVDNDFVVKLISDENVKKILKENLDKIRSELEVSTKSFSSLNLQDGDIARKASGILDLSVDIRTEFDGSPTDRAKLLNDLTSKRVTGQQILRLMGGLEDTGVSFTKISDNKTIENNRFAGLANINSYSQINDKFAGSILRRAASSSGPFSGQISSILADALDNQESTRLMSNPGVLTENEFAVHIDPIQVDRVDPSLIHNAAKIIGYIIDKNEILPNGKRKKMDPIIVERSSASAAIDPKVRYGTRYEYSIRSIALVQLKSIDEETGQTYVVSGLVSSRPSPSKIVTCLEKDPPPPPADFNFVWDYQTNELVLMWSFPVVPTRDIKRFQIFRRKLVNDPFTLLREYDFDDSVIKTPRAETPRKSRVIHMENPKTTYIDAEFNKDSTYIYSLCSIDAHDFTSNYSEQFIVSFDRYKNKLVKRYLSPSGAPKPYPNFYLREDVDADVGTTNLTVDALKVSGHDKMTIFFDPEYLSIVREADVGDSSTIELLATKGNGGQYKIQLINIDRQVGKVLNIDIDDLRPGK